MSPRKPEVELFDHQADPHEVVNLAGNPKHAGAQKRLTSLLDKWIEETKDQGRTLESRETIEREEPRANVKA